MKFDSYWKAACFTFFAVCISYVLGLFIFWIYLGAPR